jgi:type II secretory pathway pseudopilin PulG
VQAGVLIVIGLVVALALVLIYVLSLRAVWAKEKAAGELTRAAQIKYIQRLEAQRINEEAERRKKEHEQEERSEPDDFDPTSPLWVHKDKDGPN